MYEAQLHFEHFLNGNYLVPTLQPVIIKEYSSPTAPRFLGCGMATEGFPRLLASLSPAQACCQDLCNTYTGGWKGRYDAHLCEISSSSI